MNWNDVSEPLTQRITDPSTATRNARGDNPRQSWRDKFRVACRGIKAGIRGQSSFFVHFFFAALVIAAAVALGCSLLEWCILLGCIGFVLVSELSNSALETLVRGLDEDTIVRVRPALEIAAGGVLLASITASLIGTIVFLNRLFLILYSS